VRDGERNREERMQQRRKDARVEGSELDSMPSDRSSWVTGCPRALQTRQYGAQLPMPM